MRPSADRQDEYIAMCHGLERMAALYKAKRHVSIDEATDGYVRRVIRLIKKRGLRESFRRYRIRRSGVNRILPVSEPSAEMEELSVGGDAYFSDEKIAVYMAEFGGYDEIMEPVIHPDNIDYYLLTDRFFPGTSIWKRLDPSTYIPEEYQKNPVLANRWCKMHPHEIFPQYQYSVYIDANILIVSDFTVFINRLKAFPVAMFRHKNRNCVYDEIEACVIKEKAPRDKLKKHRAVLEAHGVPRKYGLAEATVIVRRHMEQDCIILMENWWQAYLAGSGRDQIALIDVLWRSNIKPAQITTLGSNLYQCDLFILMPHCR